MWIILFVKSTVKVQPGSVFCEWAWLNKNRLWFLRQFKFQRLTCEDPRIFFTLKNFNISPFLYINVNFRNFWLKIIIKFLLGGGSNCWFYLTHEFSRHFLEGALSSLAPKIGSLKNQNKFSVKNLNFNSCFHQEISKNAKNIRDFRKKNTSENLRLQKFGMKIFYV